MTSDALSLVERYFGVSFGSMNALAALPKDEQLGFMLAQAKAAGLVPAELDVSQARSFVTLLRSDLQATRNYAPRLYPGRITFLKASEIAGGGVFRPDHGVERMGEWRSRSSVRTR